MPYIVELILSVLILIGIYFLVASILENPRMGSYVEHRHKQFEKNLYGDQD